MMQGVSINLTLSTPVMNVEAHQDDRMFTQARSLLLF